MSTSVFSDCACYSLQICVALRKIAVDMNLKKSPQT